MKTKNVNLYCGATVMIDKVNYSGIITNVELPLDTIRKCLLSHIRVEEIRNDGVIVPLGFDNYNKDTTLVIETPSMVSNSSTKEKSFKLFQYDKKGNIIKDDNAEDASKKEVKVSVDIKEELKSSIEKNKANKSYKTK